MKELVLCKTHKAFRRRSAHRGRSEAFNARWCKSAKADRKYTKILNSFVAVLNNVRERAVNFWQPSPVFTSAVFQWA